MKFEPKETNICKKKKIATSGNKVLNSFQIR